MDAPRGPVFAAALILLAALFGGGVAVGALAAWYLPRPAGYSALAVLGGAAAVVLLTAALRSRRG